MSILHSAQNFIITGSQFTGTNLSGPSGIDILLEASCPNAAHDAARREYSPRCFPGTREQYIEDTLNWIIPTHGDPPTPMYWMKGPAGVGKSAIVQTCAEELKDQDRLGAAFFFSISRHNKPEEFFPSIAYQLSAIHPPYRDLIDAKIRHDKTLVKKAMSFQFRYLISEPLRELEALGKGIGKRTAVIIDGLDECDGADAQCEIIHIIASAASDGTLPLCWIFFSRPEPHIEATFARASVAPHCHNVILPISRDADGEIELYLRSSFENIGKRYNPSMESRWPSTEDMKTLVDAADGSFIYAATVIRFVNHVCSLGPQKRLHALIDIILDRRKRDPGAGAWTDTPFAALDAFYTLILQRIPTEIFPSVHLLLALICRWGSFGAILGANMLGLSKDEFDAVCHHASAVVHFQDPEKDLELNIDIDLRCTYKQINQDVLAKVDQQVLSDLGGRVALYHKSFKDFFLNPARSGSYSVKGSEALAKRYLKMHLDSSRTYCWKDSKLVLAPGVTDSGSSLSRPYTSELVNSLVKARAYIDVGGEDSESFSGPGKSGALDASCDFRKRLHIATHLESDTSSLPRNVLLWGCKCREKSRPGTSIVWISLVEFNISEFKQMIERRTQAKIIKRYHPNLSSRIKSLFRSQTRERFESALYRVGHDEKSIFWYWEIDYELGHYRHFRATDLADGEKRFREEDFASWPEWIW